jgi:hypothetical protein
VGRRRAVVLALVCWLGTAAPAAGQPADAPANAPAGYEPVVTTRDVPGYPWPETTVRRRVRATSEEVMAVYVDFDDQSRYLPDLVQCRIERRLAPARFQVFFEYKAPMLNERYTSDVTVARTATGFQMTSRLIEARYARRLDGDLRVDALGSEALIVYTNRLDPGSLGATFGSPSLVTRRLVATVQAIAAHVDRLRAEDPAALGRLIAQLNQMLPPRP